MRTVLLTLLLLFCALAQAAEFQSIAEIRAAALGTLGPNADAQAEATLDPNLQMPRCAAPLNATSGARGVAEVSCSAPTAWKLYVPLRVQRAQAIVVLTRSVGAGQPIPPEAVALQQRDPATIMGTAVSALEQAAGRVAVRTLVAGAPLLETDLVAPRAVRRGEAVTLVVHAAGIDARAPGRTLGDAGLNERVNVENVSSHRVLQGIVRAGGEVEIGF